jgi:hypothetical protein
MKVADASELHTTWAARFNAKDLDGMVALAEPDADVARRGPEGWKYVIDNPFGTL